MIIVSNTSPLSNLAVIGHLHLLSQIYPKIIIPQAVANELTNAPPEDAAIRAVPNLDWIEIQPVTHRSQVETLLQKKLDLGEAEAIALALELNADRLLIDEQLGRREASNLGIEITGILGILVAAKARLLIPAVQPIMDALIAQAGFRISTALYIRILQAANE
ncbi:DUF3368 domain-containing protein [Laspinema sp. D1]|uniref:DUF3368 domain-containing protein n=1 Tax=Laspinema palackyanum TaxID=3231601 RepID=UPI003484AEDA|nr:DUF3368 domain-containing protein [Laspinema sp. D2b]